MKKFYYAKTPPNAPPPPPPTIHRLSTPNIDTSSSKCKSPLEKTNVIEVNRSAVLADIRRGPRLKRIDPALIQDRSEAALYFGPQDVPRVPPSRGTTSLSNVSVSIGVQSRGRSPATYTGSRNSSQTNEDDRKLAGGANGAVDHPVFLKRPPSAPLRIRPPSPSPTLTHADVTRPSSRRPSSALATMTRMLSRSPSPTYKSVANLFSHSSSGKAPKKSNEKPTIRQNNVSTVATVHASEPSVMEFKTVKRQAPKPPQRATPSPTLSYDSNGNLTGIVSSTDVPRYSDYKLPYAYSKEEQNHRKDEYIVEKRPGSSLKTTPNADIRSNGTPARAIPSGHSTARNGSDRMEQTRKMTSRSPTRQVKSFTKMEASFHTKYTFHSVSSLIPPDDFRDLQKTYPSVQYSANMARRHQLPPKRSLLT